MKTLKIVITYTDDEGKGFEPMVIERLIARPPQVEVDNYPDKIWVDGKALYGVTGGSLSVRWDQNPEYK